MTNSKKHDETEVGPKCINNKSDYKGEVRERWRKVNVRSTCKTGCQVARRLVSLIASSSIWDVVILHSVVSSNRTG